MSLAALPGLREALEAHGLWAKKAFGQHFLLDLNVTRKIARLAVVGDGDLVLEVGPGPGGLSGDGDDGPDSRDVCRRLDRHRSPERVPDHPCGCDAPAFEVAQPEDCIEG